jgi:hypothetical protein
MTDSSSNSSPEHIETSSITITSRPRTRRLSRGMGMGRYLISALADMKTSAFVLFTSAMQLICCNQIYCSFSLFGGQGVGFVADPPPR